MSSNSNSDIETTEDSKAKRIQHTLSSCISRVQSVGSFATFGTLDSFPNLGISLGSIGVVPLPLSEENAKALTQESHKERVGKRDGVKIDEEVGKAWQIDSSRVKFLNQAWKKWLDGIFRRVANELGVAHTADGVRAEFYKMMLYEQGARFNAHKE